MVGGKTGTTNLLWCVHRAEWAACMHGRDLADEGIPQATLGSTGGRDIAAWWAGNKPQLTSFGVQTRHNIAGTLLGQTCPAPWQHGGRETSLN